MKALVDSQVAAGVGTPPRSQPPSISVCARAAGAQTGVVNSRGLVTFWRDLHDRPRFVRWPLKAAAFLVVLLFVLFPPIWRLPTWLWRWSNADCLVDQNHAGLAVLESEVGRLSSPGDPPDALFKLVESVVYEHVPYAFDWDTWGVMDWLPTVDEVFQAGREDCDGRAVVAASLLRRMGYQARLVTDLKHVWVVTPETELMGPGTGERTMQTDPNGTRVALSPGTLANLGRGLAFGVAVFPLTRELILLAAICLLTMHPWSGIARRSSGCALLITGLALLRAAGAEAGALATVPAFTWLGLGAAVTGWFLIAWTRRGCRGNAGAEVCRGAAKRARNGLVR